MRFVDTDIMVDVLRGYTPALAWLQSLGLEEVAFCGVVAMELLQGCKNQQEVATLERFLVNYAIYWPTATDCYRALDDVAKNHLK